MTPSRRDFLAGLIAGGGVLSLGITTGCGASSRKMIARADATGELAPNMYVTILPDGRVSLAINKCEFGQGITTGYATLVAEELDVEPASIDLHFADSFPQYRTSFGIHQTGGSTSTKEGYFPLRKAAASAREMLVGAAAASWGVAVTECTTAGGKVHHAASGRSLGYGELTRPAARRDVPDSPRLKAKSEFRFIGKHSNRVDLRAKVDGTAGFGIDVVRPNLVRATAIHPPTYGAEVTSMKDAAARAIPGVIDVIAFSWGVAVVAEKYWQAQAAARLVEVEWHKGPIHGFDSEALRTATRGHKTGGDPVRNDGNAGDALAEAATKLDAIYEAPYLAHATMEPQNCTVEVKGDKVEVWAPTQSPSVVQEFIADAIGTSRDDILVHTTLSGGGFGRRGVGDVAGHAAMIARRIGRPVQLIWSRESDMTQAYYRPQLTAHLRGGLGKDGKVTALAAHVIGQSLIVKQPIAARALFPSAIPAGLRRVMANSAVAMVGSNTLPDPVSTEGASDTPYQIPNVRVEFTPVAVKLPVSFWRSVGHSFTGFAMESFLDELAHAAKQDPLEFRRALLPADSRARRVLDAVAELAQWGSPLPPGVFRGLARHTSFETEVAEVAEVELVNSRIKVRRVFCAVDCGVAVNPDIIRAQLEGAVIFGLSAALDQEITLVDGKIQQHNFDSYPLLRMFEAPEIQVKILASDENPTGIGEPGLPPIAAAVGNAIFAGTGVRLRRMPLQRAWNEAQAAKKAGPPSNDVNPLQEATR
jgi:CO/xanthine dehydrogenase Mo-binding subunit